MERRLASAEETRAFAAEVGAAWGPGDVVLLEGELGVGKTTFVRGYLRSLGWEQAVRSPTFTLLQLYPTVPPVVHADLYRVGSTQGLGLEELLENHVALIEWPDRLGGWLDPDACWRVTLEFDGEGRRVSVRAPGGGAAAERRAPD